MLLFPNGIELDDNDAKVVLDIIPNIEEWLAAALTGKINACKDRVATRAEEVLRADPAVATLPKARDALIAELLNRPDYKDRAARDIDEAARR